MPVRLGGHDRVMLRFAVGLPNVREYADPRLVELAAEAEAAGWDGVFVWDHIAPRERTLRCPRPIHGSRWRGMAVRTQRVRLGDPWSPRSRAAGRGRSRARRSHSTRSAAGASPLERRAWAAVQQAEFAAFGEEADPAGSRPSCSTRRLAILDGLWSGEPFSFRRASTTASPARSSRHARCSSPGCRSGSRAAGPTGARSGARRSGTASSRSSRASARGRFPPAELAEAWVRPRPRPDDGARSTSRSSASARARTAPRTPRAPRPMPTPA